MKYSAAAIAVKKVVLLPVFGVSSLVVSNFMIMLVEASTTMAIRRPGYEASSRTKLVRGSASASAKNGSPVRNRRSAAWRVTEKGELRMTGKTAGRTTCVRPAFRVKRRRATRVRSEIASSTLTTRIAARLSTYWIWFDRRPSHSTSVFRIAVGSSAGVTTSRSDVWRRGGRRSARGPEPLHAQAANDADAVDQRGLERGRVDMIVAAVTGFAERAERFTNLLERRVAVPCGT